MICTVTVINIGDASTEPTIRKALAIGATDAVRINATPRDAYFVAGQIAAYAKANDIKMHLDGARIFLATPYTGVTVTEYASLFDTVYVSLYKYFNAASGAILAGPKSIIAPMYQNRRMFGSGLNQAWPFTAVANYYLDGFAERFVKAVAVSEDLIKK